MYTKTGPIRVTELQTNRSYQLWGDENTTVYEVKPGMYRLEVPQCRKQTEGP